MTLSTIDIHNVRNISGENLSFSPDINLFCGHNGSGKTSVLESIHLLGMGRSFRAAQLNHVISHETEGFCIKGQVFSPHSDQIIQLKSTKKRVKPIQCTIGLDQAASVAELASYLPVQLFNLAGFQLLAASPEERRKFLDWMMFHVKHDFILLWQQFNRALKQRNALLKARGTRESIEAWTIQLGELGQRYHETREAVFNDWLPAAMDKLGFSPGVASLSLAYEPGWDASINYTDALFGQLFHDLEVGHTSLGPHRADMQIQVRNQPAKHVLSTGQQKTFVSLMLMTQSEYVSRETSKKPLLLVDDLPSELDREAKQMLMGTLQQAHTQVFLTSVEPLKDADFLFAGREVKMFHVEHGHVKVV